MKKTSCKLYEMKMVIVHRYTNGKEGMLPMTGDQDPCKRGLYVKESAGRSVKFGVQVSSNGIGRGDFLAAKWVFQHCTMQQSRIRRIPRRDPPNSSTNGSRKTHRSASVEVLPLATPRPPRCLRSHRHAATSRPPIAALSPICAVVSSSLFCFVS